MAYPQDITSRSVTPYRHSDVPAGTHTIQNERDDSASAAIEREIDRTRRQMDDTVETLARRLRPSSLVGDLLDYFGSEEGTRMNTPKKQKLKRVARRAGRGAWDTIRDNPGPALLVAGALTWLLTRGGDDDDDDAQARYRRLPEDFYGPEYGEVFDDEHGMAYESRRRGMMRRMREYGSEAAHRAKEAMRSAGHAISDTASSIGERAREAAHNVGESVSGGMHSARGDAGQWSRSARDRAGEWSRSASDMTQRGYRYSRDRFEEGLDHYPLAMSAGALALGVVAGVLIPRTRVEDRSIGSYSHEAKLRARRLAQEAMRRGRGAAEEEGFSPRTLKDQARDLAGRVGESARHVAGAAKQAARQAAKDVGRRVKEEARSEVRELRDEAEDRGLTPGAIKQKARHVAEEAASGARGEDREDENMPAGMTAFGHVPVGEESQHQGTRPGAPPAEM